MSDTPETDALVADWTVDTPALREHARSLERRLREAHDMCDRYAEQLQAAVREMEQMRKWLDSHTIWCPPKQVPILASTSKRIWYHATDDTEHYPFTAVIDAALARRASRER